MTTDLTTPGDLTAQLGVSDRTVRRLAEAYRDVYGALPINNRRHRMFPAVAVERITAAHKIMRDVPGMSAVDAFTAHRDGVTIPRREDRTSTADTLAPVLSELRALRAEVAALRSLLVALAPEQPATALAADTASQDPAAPLQPNDTDLLERLRAGNSILKNQGKLWELDLAGKRLRRLDLRMVEALVKRGMVAASSEGYSLTSERLF